MRIPQKLKIQDLIRIIKASHFQASIEGIKTKVSTILKEIFLTRLTTITSRFDQKCPLQHWKRDLRIRQKLRIQESIRITKASHSKRQLKVLKRKFKQS